MYPGEGPRQVFEEDAVADLAIKRIALLSPGDSTTVKCFSAVARRDTTKFHSYPHVAEHYGCSKK